MKNIRVDIFGFKKGVFLTFLLSWAYLMVLVLGSCVDQLDSDPFGSCPSAKPADAIDLKITYSPYINSRFSSDQDTVSLKDFSMNFEIVPQLSIESYVRNLPGQALALSCIQTYNFKNISNIAVTLLAPFNDLPVGTDISYLLQVNPETTLNKLREFNNQSIYFSANLNIVPSNYEQLRTRTFLFLKDGKNAVIDSNSPFLKAN